MWDNLLDAFGGMTGREIVEEALAVVCLFGLLFGGPYLLSFVGGLFNVLP